MVLDTHAFLWYCLDDPRLPPAVRDSMRSEPGQVWVPTVCLWESVVLSEKGRIAIAGKDPARTMLAVFRRTRFNEAPLTAEVAALSRSLKFSHDDPADRFIAATAYSLALPLATSDKRLRSLKWLSLAY